MAGDIDGESQMTNIEAIPTGQSDATITKLEKVNIESQPQTSNDEAK